MKNGIIYKYTSPSGKIYIGQTISSNNRKNSHIHTTSKTNTKFGNAIKKYGLENFEYEEIFKTKPTEDLEKLKRILDIMEIAYINYYNSYELGYNSTYGGGGILGFTHSEETKKLFSKQRIGNKNSLGRSISEETKEKISNSNNGKKRTDEIRKKLSDCSTNKKSIIQYNKSGEFIKEWNSIIEASKELNIDPTGIGKACKGTQKTSGGFIWKFKI